MALSDNLVAYWSLGEASGQAEDAHASNELAETGTIASATGKVGNCRDFEDGSSQYFSIADNTDLSTGDIDFSFAGWIKAESLTSIHTILAKDNTTVREYGAILADDGGYKVRFYVFDSGGSVTNNTHTTTLSTATWYFVAFGHSASANETWVSLNAGTPVTASTSAGVKDGNADFRLGSTEGTARYFDGLLDEWGLWKRDIRADLTELYNAGSGRDYSYITGGGGGTTNSNLLLLGCG